MNAITKINLGGVWFTPITRGDLQDELAKTIALSGHKMILHVNAHAINLAQGDAEFREILNAAPIVFCDGFGIRLGARLLGHYVPPRITYAEWMWQLAEFSAVHGFSLFLLGAKAGIPERTAERLCARFPQLRIVGVHHGFFDKNPGSSENDFVIQMINAAQPNILIIGFGMPLQEKWLNVNWDALQVNVALTGGAALDYVAGELQRGPKWLTEHGLEWLARLLIEPSRLWRRYLLGNPQFLWTICKQRLGLLDVD